jgi:hypothetical protein
MTMPKDEILKNIQQDETDMGPGDERRDFLKKCGRFAVYAAPAMAIVLAHGAAASAAS